MTYFAIYRNFWFQVEKETGFLAGFLAFSATKTTINLHKITKILNEIVTIWVEEVNILHPVEGQKPPDIKISLVSIISLSSWSANIL